MWWVNAHSLLYTNSNANGSLFPASETGLYWPNGRPMGTRSAGDGFSVKHFDVKPGDYCGAAHTLFAQNDNMIVNVTSCVCQKPFGYLCRAPVCSSSERLRKQQYRQRLEERDADQCASVQLLLILFLVLLCLVLILSFALSCAIWILCRRGQSQGESSPSEAPSFELPLNIVKTENDGNNSRDPLLTIHEYSPVLAGSNPTELHETLRDSIHGLQYVQREQPLREESTSDAIDLNKVTFIDSE